jgi:hypothetical protein
MVDMDGVHLTEYGNRCAVQSLCDRMLGIKLRSCEGRAVAKRTKWMEEKKLNE